MKDDLVILHPDGGIASQIAFVALGLAFEQKGVKVKYDLSWFAGGAKGFWNPSNGYDKVYDITWDISKAFPALHIEIANEEEIERYKSKYLIDNDRVIDYAPPLYCYGYKGRIFHYLYAPLFAQSFAPQEAQDSHTPFAVLLQEIESSPSPCGVHIRRGDLSQPHIVYGNPTSNEYFAKSIELMCLLHPQSSFYLFSDDLAYTKEQIVPLLKGKTYRICDVNNPNQGYLDLYLLSRCRNIIGSQGSMGEFAKILSPHNPLLITPRYRNIFKEVENVMCVNWGESVQHPPLVCSAPPSLSPSSKEMRRLIRTYMKRKIMQVLEKFKIKRFVNDTIS